MKRFIFTFVLILMLILGYVYFFQISPVFVEEPTLIMEENLIDANLNDSNNINGTIENKKSIEMIHLINLLNLFEVYKLHNVPLTEDFPLISIEITDLNETYFFEVKNNQFFLVDTFLDENNKKTPDLSLVITKNALEQINETNIKTFFSDESIKINIINDEKILVLKGYKAIYDRINNKITAQLVNMPIRVGKSLELIFIILLSIIVAIIIEREKI